METRQRRLDVTEYGPDELEQAYRDGYLEELERLCESFVRASRMSGVHVYGQDGNEPAQNPQGMVVIDAYDLYQLLTAFESERLSWQIAIQRNIEDGVGVATDILHGFPTFREIYEERTSEEGMGQLPGQMQSHLDWSTGPDDS